MELDLKGMRALVLGAAGGLGAAVSGALLDEGARVAMADINEDRLREVAGSLRPQGDGSLLTMQWDLAHLPLVDARVSQVESAWGGIDILINITGGPPPTPVVGQATTVWQQYFQSMVLSIIATTDRILPGMRARRWGRIITCTSSGVISPLPNLGLSNALRSSLVGWSKTLAREVGRDRITANVVVPGRIATDRVASLDKARAQREGKTQEQVAAESIETIPAGRYGAPQEFADVVAFLASARASYVNGAMIRVDGGLITSI